ncbi:hypothetical protein EJ077_31030 [Mesorhizobium sp. M8A.F.Ca.ET.057.01.1.1]|nr:hypothetical protein EJ077_31030 [Mesorhizobium sp. M8A.F.Ca.ET.057.01.1.1]
MRGAPGNTNASLRWNTPHPSRRCAPIHLLPQGEKGERLALFTPPAGLPYRAGHRRGRSGWRGRRRARSPPA